MNGIKPKGIRTALKAWSLSYNLAKTFNLPSATVFNTALEIPISAAIASQHFDYTEAKLFQVEKIFDQLTPLALAYARARESILLSSIDNFIALSKECDFITATVNILFAINLIDKI